MSILVLDIGTSGVRAAVVRPDASLVGYHYEATPPTTPSAGFVEFDPEQLLRAVRRVAEAAQAEAGPAPVAAVTCQRASAVCFDRRSGAPLGPGIGWQDLRTAPMCLALASEHDIHLMPNQTATKAALLLQMIEDDARVSSAAVGTLDAWIIYRLSNRERFVTDPTQAAVTGWVLPNGREIDHHVLSVLGISPEQLPEITDTAGEIAQLSELNGGPILYANVGDQQAALAGHGAFEPGQAKMTFGTAGILDIVTGIEAPRSTGRLTNGTYPIVARCIGSQVHFGLEATMITAGSALRWVTSVIGMGEDVAGAVARAESEPAAPELYFVPALAGLGAPVWDFGARGALLGLDTSTTGPQLVKAVLEGIAWRTADLIEATEADFGSNIGALAVDGGLTNSQFFLQAVANRCQRVLLVDRQRETTTLGAAVLAGLASGQWSSYDQVREALGKPMVVEPKRRFDRSAWLSARAKSSGHIPELSALVF